MAAPNALSLATHWRRVVALALVAGYVEVIGRYLQAPASGAPAKQVSFKEVLLPASAWLSYSLGAAAGAFAASLSRLLLVPAAVMPVLMVDLLALGT